MCPRFVDAADSDEGVATELEFEADESVGFLVALSRAADTTVRLHHWLDCDGGSVDQFFSAGLQTMDPVRELAGRFDTVSEIESLGRRDTTHYVKVVTQDGGLPTLLERCGAILSGLVATGGTGRIVAAVPPGIRSTAVVERVLEAYPDCELTARRQRSMAEIIGEPRTVEQLMRDGLTDRQWEVMQTAYRAGYFKRPRETTGEEMAERLGISSATFSQHLRAAQQSLLSMAVSSL